MTTNATGTFEVTMSPQGPDDIAEGSTLSRLSLSKRFHGDLEAVSKGDMMTAMGEVEGSAGYVAIERVTGTLHGRRGSFVLQHGGIMTKSSQQLTILVVPDSGSGELTGLSGRLAIKMEEGVHSYRFEYILPDLPPGPPT
ncbi:MAG: DUF3224 domain-containing protein [Thermoplasmata archaeon]|nr:DUF3224 domain-containing protein [Thermoplasmata archaeon]